jgi:2-iminobutanoate/2-iminopropanoate deaminase
MKMIKSIHTNNAPEAIGPYSQAIQAGDFVFVSGQIPVDPETGKVADGIEKQTEQVMENLNAVLKEVGTDFTQAIKCTIYLSSMEDFATINKIYGSYLIEPFPARATVEVSRLPKDVLIEIDVVAHIKK